MAWGADTNAAQLTSITTEQFFSTLVTLNPGETAVCQVSVDFPTTPVDDALIAVYATLDDTAEVWDISPFYEVRMLKGIDPSRITFSVSGVYKFRVGVRRSGTTDTLTSADMSYRKDGVSA